MPEGWHGGSRHGSGFRPPWWPEDEPFPPRGPEAWRGMRDRFVRRIALFFALFLGLMFFVGFLASRFFTDGFHERDRGPFPFLGVVAVLVVVVLVVRWLRRTAAPIGEVMAGVDRVAAGDYSVRVAQTGSNETRRLVRAFNQMAERLETAEARRRELVADVAHEIRTPLSVIRGDLEGMLDGVYPVEAAQLARILEETTVMARLLDDLQTLSTAEAGALRLHRETVGAGVLVEDAVGAFAARARARDVSLSTSVAEGLPDLDVDPMRIGEVLTNLLSNALRHTPRGGSITVEAVSEEPDVVAFTVRDTGEGIPAADLPHVFERFVQADDSGGSGLGLTIARSLVLAHGGSITAESEPGRGTAFRFTLPVTSRTPDTGR
jgi:signal transduction histidine kinase